MFLEYSARVKRAIRERTGEGDPCIVDGGEHGDLASTIAFPLARKERKAPAQIAAGLAKDLGARPDLAGIRVHATGPYLNFVFGEGYLRDSIEGALKSGYGNLPAREGRVVIEHTSANPNGPLHVGHIRNTIIGDCLTRAFRKAGYRVETHYYVNDMGRQIAIVVWAVDRYGEGDKGEKGDDWIAKAYIAANRDLEGNTGAGAEIDRLMQRVEAGDPEVARKFQAAVTICLDGIKKTLSDLGVSHDRFIWESDFVRNGDVGRVLSRIRRLEEYREDETIWLDLAAQGFKKPYILRRSDGTTVYAARDIAYHIWKGRNFSRLIDVLGADHKLIGAQLVATLGILGEIAPTIVHFEFVSLPEGSMSTRQGKFVSADALMTEVAARAYDEVTNRRTELGEEDRRAIARAVSIAAIRYDMVKISPEKSMIFDWKEALDFERQSGPYVQYAHARACSILEKTGPFTRAYEFQDPREIALAKAIARFPAVIEQVSVELRPHLLASYVHEVANLFNTFYQHLPVLKSEGRTRESRLTLVDATRNTLKEALLTLGIDALSTM
ncbi:MAG: arginine--tRNA ligase [Methanomicrobiales archaeon]|nr:arginine--tRNA ligase [Methanomicrobiales archaeon]MDD1669270.1 arginine--tRNA ligase [Methanomicrobiales archaeon]